MSLFPQSLLDLHDELIIDLFAGGGGASSGIEQATGRMVDVAINHDAAAVGMHQANHPQTMHFVSDVFEVDPREVTHGRRVGLLWASPDCTYHSKARGSKPIRLKNKKRRALAWIVIRWAATVRPRVIALENVEEFEDWGPLVGPPDALRPCRRRRGKTFRQWVKMLQDLGYTVEWRELRACDYGAPTIRKRLFVIARCDGQPVVWPQPTHGKTLKPFRTAAECIDWSIPMCSIFATKDEAKEWAKMHGRKNAPVRPLAENSMRRIARGVRRFVLENAKPFLVALAHGEGTVKPRWGEHARDLDKPMTTLKTSNETALVTANLISYHDEQGAEARASNLESPLGTIDCANRHGLVATFLGQYNGGFAEGNSGDGHNIDAPLSTISVKGPHQAVTAAVLLDQGNGGFENRVGHSVDEPISTITTTSPGHHGLIAAHIQRDFGTSTGHEVDKPIGTITSDGGGKAALVASFLERFNGTGTGQKVDEPIGSVTSKDRFGFVTVVIDSVQFYIADILMRMLAPRELYLCQGFRPGYIIDRTHDGKPITTSQQVHMVGNSVSPLLAEALIAANCAELVVRRAA